MSEIQFKHNHSRFINIDIDKLEDTIQKHPILQDYLVEISKVLKPATVDTPGLFSALDKRKLDELSPIAGGFKYIYKSTEPLVRHQIHHNLNTLNLKTEIMVQDPIDESWRKDIVEFKLLDPNNAEVWLTESSNVLVLFS